MAQNLLAISATPGLQTEIADSTLRPKQILSNATTGILQVVGPAAASTRVMTTPDANFTAARTDAAQTFTGMQMFPDGVASLSGFITLGAGATGTLFTPGSGTGYLVSVCAANGDANTSGVCIAISRYGTSLPVLATLGSHSLTFGDSSGALQITNTTIYSFDYNWRALRLVY